MVVLCYTADVIFFFSVRSLNFLADRCETLLHCWKYVLFCNRGPKIWGCFPKNLGPKNVQNSGCSYFGANIAAVDGDIHNRKTNVSKAILLMFTEKGQVNFGPLATKIDTCISLAHSNPLFRPTIFQPLHFYNFTLARE